MEPIKDYLFADQANAKVDELTFAVWFLARRCRFRQDGHCLADSTVCPAREICRDHNLGSLGPEAVQ